MKVIRARGVDISGTVDSFFFVEQMIESNSYLSNRFEIEMHTQNGFESASSLHAWAKFGLMIRESLDPSAPYFSILLTPKSGVHVFYRSSQGGGSTRITGNLNARGGGWLKIECNVNQFRAYYRKDPSTDEEETYYVLMAEQSISMSGEVHVGVALSSRYSDKYAVAKYDKFLLKVSCTRQHISNLLANI